MNTREQFGNYLLLKKLSEDPLGETFRAGLLGGKGMERVVLLRVFNGQGIDGQRLWEATKDRTGVHEQLRSPNIGEGVEMGQLEGIPYVAYDYVSGKNLATLLEQSAKKRNYIPAEHALLISERLALALATASETRYQGDRVLHGFLVPQLAMISNEGETRLLGFGVAPGLRGFAANPVVRQHFGRYLAPETLASEPIHRSDDIYSLGVILYELLTGKPLPPPAADGYQSLVDQAELAAEGTPVPAELRDLLKKSLVPRAQRIPDAGTWHKTLNKWMFEGQYNPTTFNLAFFMHNLFRQEIERESQEIEVERTLPVPVVKAPEAPTPPAASPAAAAAAPAASPAPPTSESTGVGVFESTGTGIHAPPAKSKTPLLVAAAIAVAILLGLGVFYFLSQRGEAEAEAALAAQTVPPPPVAPPPPTGPSEEELQAQIEALISRRAGEMEEQIRQDYDDKLGALRDQLDSAREANQRARAEAAERERQRLEAERRAAEEEAAAAAAPPPPPPPPPKVAETEPEPAEPEPVTQVAEVTPPPPPPPRVAPPPPPRAPQVRRGDMVTMGPGVKPPKNLSFPAPRFPAMARRFNKTTANVRVRVLVDENGDVLDTELAGEEAGYGFDAEALAAARKAKFEPPTKDDVPVKMWYTLSVNFQE